MEAGDGGEYSGSIYGLCKCKPGHHIWIIRISSFCLFLLLGGDIGDCYCASGGWDLLQVWHSWSRVDDTKFEYL